jgi:putative ABC transport system permease protein
MIGAIIALAIKSIMLNKVRSFLTMLGVIIGVGSVVMLTGIGTGLQSYISDQFAALGTNTLYVVPGNPFGEGGGFSNQEQAFIETTRPVLKRAYLDRILRNHREIFNSGTATAVGVAEARFGSTTKKATLYGVMPAYSQVQNTNTTTGRWFDKNEETNADRVVVLGPTVAEELFGKVDPINKQLKLNGQNYTVLGVLEEKGGGFGGPSFDSYIYVPLETLFQQFDATYIDSLIFEVRSQDQLVAATAAIENELLRDLEDDDFSVFDQTQLLNTINQILGALTAGLGGIAAISLVVGGIGIMNIMLVSVTERTREIGLRKALGATPRMILLQFLIEAALLSIIGGLIGLLVAFAGVQVIKNFFPATITLQAVMLAFGVSTAVGLIFGVAPARKAAKLSPIEALRYE